MMRKRTDSNFLLALTAGRSLLFLFFLFPIFIFANNKDSDKKDSLADHSENKAQIYISEGATIYNAHLMYAENEKINTADISVNNQADKKKTIVSKSAKNKTKKPSQVVKSRVAPTIAERFKSLPVDPANFFAKNNTSKSILLPANKQIKDLEFLKQDCFFVLNDFTDRNSSVFHTNINSKAHQWQNHVRPPPAN